MELFRVSLGVLAAARPWLRAFAAILGITLVYSEFPFGIEALWPLALETIMTVKRIITNGTARVLVWTEEIEQSAFNQLRNLSRLPIIHNHIAAMPDIHTGIGSTIGAVIPTKGAIIPAAVGVDIGCGMNAVRLSLSANDLPDKLRPIRTAIESAIPVGFDKHKHPAAPRTILDALAPGLNRILDKHPAITRMQKRPRETWMCQLGTLGGGNHFIELCLDEHQNLWVMLHSGSRGIGNTIGRYFIALAKQDMKQQLGNLPDKDLAYFSEGAGHFSDYVEAVRWAQDYALANRRELMRLIIQALRSVLPPFELTDEAINCHHNYVALEEHYGQRVYLTRKGAIRAGKDELGIIPGSMGSHSYIVRGLGNPESFDSCAHGAGRRMSRHAAKRAFNTLDIKAQTRGVECRKDRGVIDEIPAAYKDIDAVMADQMDLVEVVHRLKQIICVKG